MRVVMMGPPGAGKGTQSVRIAQTYHVPHISTGDMFRSAIAAGAELGRQAQAFMEAGKLVPDGITLGIVKERLSQPDAATGFVLDGFPRTVPQARGLAEVLAEQGVALDQVILLDVPDEELVRRAERRRVCQECGRVYSMDFTPPSDGKCECGGILAQRRDDLPEIVENRLAVYHSQTEPLREYYQGTGELTVVDGRGTLDGVYEQVVHVLGRCKR